MPGETCVEHMTADPFVTSVIDYEAIKSLDSPEKAMAYYINVFSPGDSVNVQNRRVIEEKAIKFMEYVEAISRIPENNRSPLDIPMEGLRTYTYYFLGLNYMNLNSLQRVVRGKEMSPVDKSQLNNITALLYRLNRLLVDPDMLEDRLFTTWLMCHDIYEISSLYYDEYCRFNAFSNIGRSDVLKIKAQPLHFSRRYLKPLSEIRLKDVISAQLYALYGPNPMPITDSYFHL